MTNVLIGCTGSVATIKLALLVSSLMDKLGLKAENIRVVVTESAKHFYNPVEIAKGVQILTDEDEWAAWSGRGDPVLHIELGKWANLFLIAPLDANTLAKLSQGLCDNLLTCTARAWDTHKPLVFCPAMNTRMYEHPLTSLQISTLQSWGYHSVPVVEKTLMCGDTGTGAMAEVTTIIDYIKKLVNTNE